MKRRIKSQGIIEISIIILIIGMISLSLVPVGEKVNEFLINSSVKKNIATEFKKPELCPELPVEKAGCSYEYGVDNDNCPTITKETCCPDLLEDKTGCKYQTYTDSNGCPAKTELCCDKLVTEKPGCVYQYDTTSGCKIFEKETCPPACTDETCPSGYVCTFKTGSDGCQDIDDKYKCPILEEEKAGCTYEYGTDSHGCKIITKNSCCKKEKCVTTLTGCYCRYRTSSNGCEYVDAEICCNYKCDNNCNCSYAYLDGCKALKSMTCDYDDEKWWYSR